MSIFFSPKHFRDTFYLKFMKLIDYAFKYLNVHQLYANITANNSKSISLFTKHKFKKVGIKKDWILSEGKFKDEILFQLINE